MLKTIRTIANTDKSYYLTSATLGCRLEVYFAKNIKSKQGGHGKAVKVQLENIRTGEIKPYDSYADANEAVGRKRLDPHIKHCCKKNHVFLTKYRVTRLSPPSLLTAGSETDES